MNDSCESINSVSSDCSVITLSTVSPSESSDEESVYFHENQMLSIIEANIKKDSPKKLLEKLPVGHTKGAVETGSGAKKSSAVRCASLKDATPKGGVPKGAGSKRAVVSEVNMFRKYDILKKKSEERGEKSKKNVKVSQIEVPTISKPSLGSFKIPRVKSNLKNDQINNSNEEAPKVDEVGRKLEERSKERKKRSRKELKEDVRKVVVFGDLREKDDLMMERKEVKKVGDASDELGSPKKVKLWTKAKNFAKPPTSKIPKSALSWVDAVVWSDQVAPDSRSADDEPIRTYEDMKTVDADDVSDCSSESRDRDDSSWKRQKLKRVIDNDEFSSRKKVKSWIADEKFSNNPTCFDPVRSSSLSHQVPPYTMSLKVLDKLGPKSLFDPHCHLDIILFRRSHMELESFDQFVQAYPLMGHTSLEGFITNFCSPKLWTEHLVSPSPLIHSLLSRPSVYYTIGCHPRFARELLISRNYTEHGLVLLIQKAGSSCVAIGECGLDDNLKNNVKIADQVEAFKLQLKLAIRFHKPLVLLIKGHEKEAIRAMEQVGVPADWPIHR